jgi:uncharacterized protein (DUF2225 family)
MDLEELYKQIAGYKDIYFKSKKYTKEHLEKLELLLIDTQNYSLRGLGNSYANMSDLEAERVKQTDNLLRYTRLISELDNTDYDKAFKYIDKIAEAKAFLQVFHYRLMLNADIYDVDKLQEHLGKQYGSYAKIKYVETNMFGL